MAVPAGTQHYFANTGRTPRIFSPKPLFREALIYFLENIGGKDEPPAFCQRSKAGNERPGIVTLSGKY
jgi:hypothetical protein